MVILSRTKGNRINKFSFEQRKKRRKNSQKNRIKRKGFIYRPTIF